MLAHSIYGTEALSLMVAGHDYGSFTVPKGGEEHVWENVDDDPHLVLSFSKDDPKRAIYVERITLDSEGKPTLVIETNDPTIVTSATGINGKCPENAYRNADIPEDLRGWMHCSGALYFADTLAPNRPEPAHANSDVVSRVIDVVAGMDLHLANRALAEAIFEVNKP